MENIRILAKDRTVTNDSRRSGLNNNDLVIGPSGAGKTSGYVIPNIRALTGSLVVADTKGNLARQMGPALRRRGWKVHTLDFVDPERSCAYNPLDYVGRRTGPDGTVRWSEKDILTIATALAPPVPGDRDPFWTNSARQVLVSLVGFVLEALPPEEKHLGSVVELYRILSHDPGTFRALFRQLEDEDPDSSAVRRFKMYSSVMTVDRTWNCIAQFVSDALDPFDFREIRSVFHRPSDFRLEDLGRERTVLFVNISDTDRSLDRLADLFYTQAIHTLCASADASPDSRLAVPVRIILDDFATNAYIPDFDKTISVIRSRDLSVSIILQSLTQLQSLYTPAQAATIISNCDHLLYLGGQDMQTADFISRRVNRSPSSVLSMPLEKAYLLTRGRAPELVDRWDPFAPGADAPSPEAAPAPLDMSA